MDDKQIKKIRHEKIQKAAKLIKQNSPNNYIDAINLLMPVWIEFILCLAKHLNLDEKKFKEMTGDEKLLFIEKNYPLEYAFQLFWAKTILMLIE